MHLYNVTLQQASVVVNAVVGSFSGTAKCQEIIVSKGSSLEMLRVDPASGKTVSVINFPIFGIARSLASFRVTGGSKDYLIVGSDSGRIVILEYIPASNSFSRVHTETFGKSGVRRIVPGEYVATDPKGRAVLIAAVEKQKFVYILNRDAATRLTISSPLEAHRANTITFSLIGVDVAFDNPIFAAIEAEYLDTYTTEEATVSPHLCDKLLVYYELDLGLNHVVRKATAPIDHTSNLLLPVPGGADGPSGVLVCSANCISWMSHGEEHKTVRLPIPRRINYLEDPTRTLIIACGVTHKLKRRFFVLVQSEEGDLYRITLEYEPGGGTVTEMRIKYFDTVPVATSLIILKSGYLYVAAEFGNQYLYTIDDLGDDDEEQPEYLATDFASVDMSLSETFVYFKPRELRNLSLVDVSDATNPLMDARVMNLTKAETPQIYALCGRGAQSSFRVLNHGIEVAELAVTEVPSPPRGVWTARLRFDDPYDAYIIVAFANTTSVFAIGETVEEVTDSGLLVNVTSLLVQHMGDEDIIQVHPRGIRHVKADKRTFEWKCALDQTVLVATANRRQILLALSNGELVYFELDASGMVSEFPERKQMPAAVTCMDIGAVPSDRKRNRFVAVGSADNIVRILSLDPDSCMEGLSMQALNSLPHSLCIVEMKDPLRNGYSSTAQQSNRVQTSSSTTAATSSSSAPSFGGGMVAAAGLSGVEVNAIYLNIGLENGVIIRSTVDEISGEILDSRPRFLGPCAPSLFRILVGGENGMIALSSRPWINYTFQGQTRMDPLAYEALDAAAQFSSEQCPEGLVAVTQGSVRIFVPEKLGRPFNQASVELSYTPRRMAMHPVSCHFAIAECDQNTYAASESDELLRKKAVEYEDDSVNLFKEEFPEQRYGLIHAAKGKWASCVRILNPFEGVASQIIQLEPDEAAFSLCVLQFASVAQPSTSSAVPNQGPDGLPVPPAFPNVSMEDASSSAATNVGYYLVVGTVVGLRYPQTYTQAYLRTYRFVDGGTRVEYVHRTPIEKIALALAPFHGRLAAGVGGTLRLYDLGRLRLLRKAEGRALANAIVWIGSQGNRLVLADSRESIHFAAYRALDNRLAVFADDILPRCVTCAAMLDYDTVVGGDRFGNIFVVRIERNLSREIDDDPTGNRVLYDKPLLGGAPHKLEHVADFHVGDWVTSVHRTAMVPGGREVVVYTTLGGGIGCLIPFASKDDIDFFLMLEMHMRIECESLVARDHMHYRSYYKPVKGVVDGDLCQEFLRLSLDRKQRVATEMNRTLLDITKKLEDIRTRVVF